MTTYTYKAIAFKQSPGTPVTVLFAAAANDIDQWAGIPEKKSFAAGESDSTGFQREFNGKREDDLVTFFSQEKNTLQNPLLCATLRQSEGNVRFIPNDGNTNAPYMVGELVIDDDYLENATTEQLFALLRSRLEKRVPGLKGKKPSEAAKARVREFLNKNSDAESRGDVDDSEVSDEENNAADVIAESESEFSTSSHVEGFWEEVAARHEVLKELQKNEAFDPSDEFAGYSRQSLLSYVRPVVLVDGQHRLRGAVLQSRNALNSPKAVLRLRELMKVHDRAAAERELYREYGRSLPVSLLLDDDPAEHVFQFVVVNQKATPIGKALLGTIVSTTLSETELQGVSDRLENASIHLDASRAVSLTVLDRDSPFYGFVNRGLKGGQKGLLDWNVMVSLVKVFRNLQGARVWGSENDFAVLWQRTNLEECQIIPAGGDGRTALEKWSDLNGPWKGVFFAFWEKIRDKFGSNDPEALNAWGSTEKSQLFNKISLNILASDFFAFMQEKSLKINTVEDVSSLMDLWLTGVQPDYFSRAWGGDQLLRGIKKDSVGIRNQWSKLWRDYRQNPARRPSVGEYRKALSA